MELSPDFTFHDALLLLLRSQMGNCGFLWGFFFFWSFPQSRLQFFLSKNPNKSRKSRRAASLQNNKSFSSHSKHILAGRGTFSSVSVERSGVRQARLPVSILIHPELEETEALHAEARGKEDEGRQHARRERWRDQKKARGERERERGREGWEGNKRVWK